MSTGGSGFRIILKKRNHFITPRNKINCKKITMMKPKIDVNSMLNEWPHLKLGLVEHFKVKTFYLLLQSQYYETAKDLQKNPHILDTFDK